MLAHQSSVCSRGSCLVYSITDEGTRAVIEKDLDSLTAAEIVSHFPLVEAAIRKE